MPAIATGAEIPRACQERLQMPRIKQQWKP